MDGAVNLGGFELGIRFDPAIVQAEGAALSSWVSGATRQFVALGPTINNGAGTVSFGAFSYGMDPGLTGSGALAWFTFRAVVSGTSSLVLFKATLTDTEAVPIPVSVTPGSVVVQPALRGDLDCDCDVDIVDIMMVAGAWNSRVGDARYNPRYDLDSDGDVDIVDIMTVAVVWNTRC